MFFITIIRFIKSLFSGFRDHEFRAIFSITTITLASGTLFYHQVEKWDWLDSLYFSVTTLTTVGFGDFSPQTTQGKVFTIFYIFVGIGTILAFINSVAKQTRSSYSLEAQNKLESVIKNRLKK